MRTHQGVTIDATAIPAPEELYALTAEPETLEWAHWESNSSLFNPFSGDTHLLTALPVYVIESLCNGARSVGWISSTTADACSARNDAEWQQKILSLLGSLEDLEIIRRLGSA